MRPGVRSLVRGQRPNMPSASDLPDYAVVVVSYDSGPEVQTFVHSLEVATHPPCFLVIVENAAGTPAPLKTDIPIRFIHLAHNPGYGSAINAGVAALPLEVEWVLVSNPDVVLEPEAPERLLRVALEHPRAGALGPALINPDGTVYPSAREIPGIGIGAGHALLGWMWKTNPWTKAYRGTYESLDPRPSGWLSGACVLVNHSAFTGIGGFDENYFMFMEDVDLGWRLGEAGYPSVYVPSARAHHTVGHSTSKDKSSMARAHHQSAKRFISRQYPAPWHWPLRTIVKVGLTLRQWLVRAAHNARPGKAP